MIGVLPIGGNLGIWPELVSGEVDVGLSFAFMYMCIVTYINTIIESIKFVYKFQIGVVVAEYLQVAPSVVTVPANDDEVVV